MNIVLAGRDLERDEIFRLQQEIIGAAGKSAVCMWIQCAGGEVKSSFGCYETAMALLGDKLTTKAIGSVASMGVIVFLAGAKRMIGRKTTLFLHPIILNNPPDSSFDRKQLRCLLYELEALEKIYASIVSERTGLSSKMVLRMMAKETTLDAEKAVRLGFAHEIFGQ